MSKRLQSMLNVVSLPIAFVGAILATIVVLFLFVIVALPSYLIWQISEHFD